MKAAVLDVVGLAKYKHHMCSDGVRCVFTAWNTAEHCKSLSRVQQTQRFRWLQPLDKFKNYLQKPISLQTLFQHM